MSTALATCEEPRFLTTDMAYAVAGTREDHFLMDRPRVSHESEYYIQGGTELLEMTGDVSCFASRMGFSMDDYLDNFDWDHAQRLGLHPGYTLAGCMGVREHFKYWYNQFATPMERAFVGMALISCVGFQFQEFHWGLSDDTIKRMLDNKSLPDDGPTKADLIQTLEGDDRLSLWINMVAEGYRNAVPAIAAVGVTALNEYGEEQERKARAAFEAAHQWIGHPGEAFFDPANNRPRKLKPVKIEQRTRSAIKKGINMLTALVGPEPVRSYISGDGFKLEGNLFDYKVSKTVGIISHTQNTGNGHTPYRLTIFEKGTETVLGDACVYFKDTPVIDQLIALTFFIRNGEEEELIKTANIFSRTEAYSANAIIAELKPGKSIFDGVGGGTLGLRDMINDIPNGVNPYQHREEIVPWRIRTMDMCIEILSERTGMPLRYLRSVIDNCMLPMGGQAAEAVGAPWLEASPPEGQMLGVCFVS